jgi:predicted acetyltransferase
MTTTTNEYGTLREDDARIERIIEIENDAFGGDVEDTRRYVENMPVDAWRTWETGGRVQGALAFYDAGQWFGGRSVPMWGIAAVGIASEDRGRGVATRLMRATVAEAHERGVALSTLYPAVQPLYRRAGYERAGHLYSVCLTLREIAPLERGGTLRSGTADDEATVEALERDRSRAADGALDRCAQFWRRTRVANGKPTRLHVVEEDGTVTGFVRWRHVGSGKNAYVNAGDVVATTPTSARRLLAFFADQAAQTPKAYWFGHPADPLCRATESLCTAVKIADVWMLRITHLENALSARGYAPGLTADVHLDVEDDLCPGNAGRFVLRVADGTGVVERGGDGRIAIDIRSLASVYTGHAHPFDIRSACGLSGSDADLALLGAVFAGPDPRMYDAF